LLKATVRVRRVLERLRPGHPPTSRAAALRARGLTLARTTSQRLRDALAHSPASLPVEADASPPAPEPDGRRYRGDFAHPKGRLARLISPVAARLPHLDGGVAGATSRLAGRERVLPLTVAGLVLAASIVSVAPVAGRPSSAGTDATSAGPRLVVGGGVLAPGGAGDVAAADVAGMDTGTASGDVAAGVLGEQHILAAEYGQDAAVPVGPYLADGTLLKPVAVDPEVPDGSDQLETYRVKSGDTLTGIAHKFGISMMTLWWANKLSAKDELHVGQQLIIPPTDGLVVTVQAGETLDTIAQRSGVPAGEILTFNHLLDSTLVAGQVLIVPGARGAGIATPTPKPTPKSTTKPSRTTTRSTTRTTTVRAPSTYSGGRFAWPIPGHRVTQYYHYGHLGVDIQGSLGDKVDAAAAGTVIYAGWRNNGGGYVVWISHGSGLYTTYNHLSAVLTATGRHVSRGQVIGRVGATGWATGPHLHFEVWRGGVPGGVDRRVNPMAYY
jgi:murein DD-endopeptidase MepM/ murein hydrolase activator NlpD